MNVALMMILAVIEWNTIALAITMEVRIFCIQSDSFALELWQTKQNIGSSRVNKLRPLPCSCVFQSAFLKDERTWQNVCNVTCMVETLKFIDCVLHWMIVATNSQKKIRGMEKKVQKGREACFVCIVQRNERGRRDLKTFLKIDI